jgi:hypothetical protein
LRDAAALSLGVYSRIAAVALAQFVAFVSLAFLQFWSIKRPADARAVVRNCSSAMSRFLADCSASPWPAPAGLRSSTSGDPDRLPEIRQEVYPEQSGSKSEVCLAFPAMQAAAEGFNVYGAIDASGSPDAVAREMTVARLVAHGVTPVNWIMVASELQRDRRLPTGQAMTQLFHEHNPNYSMLMDSFQAHSKQEAAK